MDKPVVKALGAVGIFILSAIIALFITSAVNPNKPQETANTTTPQDTSKVEEITQPKNTSPESAEVVAEKQDTEVKNTIADVSLAFANYTANNRGSIPNTDAMLESFKANYLTNVDLNNPTTNTDYVLLLNPAAATTSIIAYKPNYTCDLEDTTAPPVMAKSRQYALHVILPSGKSFCIGS